MKSAAATRLRQKGMVLAQPPRLRARPLTDWKVMGAGFATGGTRKTATKVNPFTYTQDSNLASPRHPADQLI